MKRSDLSLAILLGIVAASLLGGLTILLFDKRELQARLREKEEQLNDIYYGMGCGDLPNKRCETVWGFFGDQATEKHGIAPVSCAEKDAVVWVNPIPENPGAWTFRCVPGGSK